MVRVSIRLSAILRIGFVKYRPLIFMCPLLSISCTLLWYFMLFLMQPSSISISLLLYYVQPILLKNFILYGIHPMNPHIRGGNCAVKGWKLLCSSLTWSTFNQSINVEFVGRRYTTRPGAPAELVKSTIKKGYNEISHRPHRLHRLQI